MLASLCSLHHSVLPVCVHGGWGGGAGGPQDELFSAVFPPASGAGPGSGAGAGAGAGAGPPKEVRLTRCGLCKGYLTLVSSRPQRLLCATCSQTYALPQEGTVKCYGEVR
jgi:hypothetical protein